VKISSVFVAFLENMNFTLWRIETRIFWNKLKKLEKKTIH
jgi:hypothetical protein